MSSTAGAGASVPPDTTPDYPPAEPPRVRSAVEALSQVLRNLPRQEFPGTAAPDHGQRVARADDLVKLLAANNHEPAAAAWAIHECVRAGWLIPEVRNEEVEVGGREEIDRNSIVARAERFFGNRGRVPTVRIPGRMVPRPTFTGPGPVPFDCLLVRTTPALWVRPSEPPVQADGGTADDPPVPTPARQVQVEGLSRTSTDDTPRPEAAPTPQSGCASPPTPLGGGRDGPPPTNAGFPHYGRYLPDGYNHSFLRLWPDAERQLRRFEQAVEVANRKLPGGTRLPGELVQWWYRHWAGELMARTGRPAGSAAEVRALYTFGRLLDRLLGLSTSQPDEPFPRDIEFTFYDELILRGDGHGNNRPDPLSNIRRDLLEEQTGMGMELEPVAFPGRVRAHHALGWRLPIEEFLDWAGFLCADGELTEEQREVLAHIAYCTRGENDWCRAFGTHTEQCRPLGDNLLRRIQDDIVRVSDELRIEVRTIGRAGTFRESLNDVSGWLAAAEAAEAETRIERHRRNAEPPVREVGPQPPDAAVSGNGEDVGMPSSSSPPDDDTRVFEQDGLIITVGRIPNASDGPPPTVDELRPHLAEWQRQDIERVGKTGDNLYELLQCAAEGREKLPNPNPAADADVRSCLQELGVCRELLGRCERYADEADRHLRIDTGEWISSRRTTVFLEADYTFSIRTHAIQLRGLIEQYTDWLTVAAHTRGVLAAGQQLDTRAERQLGYAVGPGEAPPAPPPSPQNPTVPAAHPTIPLTAGSHLILTPLLAELRALEPNEPTGTCVEFARRVDVDSWVLGGNVFVPRVDAAGQLQQLPVEVCGVQVGWMGVRIQTGGREYRAAPDRVRGYAEQLLQLGERAGVAVGSDVQSDGPRFWAAVCEAVRDNRHLTHASPDQGWVGLHRPATAARIAVERWLSEGGSTSPPNPAGGGRGGEGEASGVLPTLLSAPDIAERIGQNRSSVTSFLTRYAAKYPDCRTEVPDKRPNEPSYLYRTSEVWPALQEWVKGRTAG